jgi:uncharacterized protein YjcR
MADLEAYGLSNGQMQLVEWLATPKSNRCHQKDLAEDIGVSEKTIWKWKQKQEIIDAAYDRKRELVKADDLPDIIDALVEKAKEGKVRQAELILEWIGELDSSKFGNSNNTQINIDFSGIPRPQETVVDVGGGGNG